MIEKSLYNNYTIDFSLEYRTVEEAYYFIFNSKRHVYLTEDKSIPLVALDTLENFDKIFIL